MERKQEHMSVALKEVTAETVRAVMDLKVSPEQVGYVAANAVSISQAYFARDAWFRAIYAEDKLVGFAMLRDGTLLPSETAKPAVSLWQFMISQDHQGRGYGRDALALLVAHARSRPEVKVFETSYVAGPHSPKSFYIACGFEHTGEVNSNREICLSLKLAR